MSVNSRELTQLPDGSMMDLVTGEVFGGEEGRQSGTFVFIPRRQKLTGWIMTFQDALEELSKDRELWGQPMAVLFYLLSKMDFENKIYIQQTDISEALGIDKYQTSKIIKKLINKGIVSKGQKTGRPIAYELNISYGWKGKVVNFRKEQKRQFDVINGGIKTPDATTDPV